MANLTVTVDDSVLKRARIKAIERNTSVNAEVAAFLARYVGNDGQTAARRILDTAAKSASGSGKAGRSWTRDSLHE